MGPDADLRRAPLLTLTGLLGPLTHHDNQTNTIPG